MRKEDRPMFRRMILGGLAVVALLGAPSLGQGQVSMSIGINLPAPPSFVVVPGTPVAYAPTVPANYFFYGGQYYVFTGGAWYTGPGYNGPWVAVAPAYIPLPLLSVPIRYYKAPPPHWKEWRRAAPPRWDPAWGHEWKKGHKEYEKAYKDSEKHARKESH
jgi:hypothetical protein